MSRPLYLLVAYFERRAQALFRKLAAPQINKQKILTEAPEVGEYLNEFIKTKDEEDQRAIEPLILTYQASLDAISRIFQTLAAKQWVESEKLFMQIAQLLSNVVSTIEFIDGEDRSILADEQGRDVGQAVTQMVEMLRGLVSQEYEQSGAAVANQNLRRVNPLAYQDEAVEPEYEEPEESTFEYVDEPEAIDSVEEEPSGFESEVETGKAKQKTQKVKMNVLTDEQKKQLSEERAKRHKERMRQEPNYLVNKQNREREYYDELKSAIESMRADPTTNVKVPDWILRKRSPVAYNLNAQREKAYQNAYKRIKYFMMPDAEVAEIQKKNPALYEDIVQTKAVLNVMKQNEPENFAKFQNGYNAWKVKLDRQKEQKAKRKAEQKV